MQTITFRRFSFLQRLLINTIMLLALAGLFKQGLYFRCPECLGEASSPNSSVAIYSANVWYFWSHC